MKGEINIANANTSKPNPNHKKFSAGPSKPGQVLYSLTETPLKIE